MYWDFMSQGSVGPEQLGIDMHSPVISGAGEAVSCDPVPDGGVASPLSLQSGRNDVHKVREITGKVRTHKPKNKRYGLHLVPDFIAAGGNISHRTPGLLSQS